MCVKPVKVQVEKGVFVDTACRKCEQCLAAKKRHAIGRVMAESETASHVQFVTWTYGGGDHYRSSWLHYEDLQKTFKILRKRGFRFKHVSVGEYGGAKERAHFHSLIMWRGPKPDFPENAHLWWHEINKKPGMGQDIWPHGFVQFEQPKNKQACATYILDYFKKGADARLKPSVRMGEDYLNHYAKRHALEGLPLFPNGDRFTIPGNVSAKTGKLFWYTVGRKSVTYEHMCETFFETWFSHRFDQPIRVGEELKDQLWDEAQNPEKYSIHRQYAMRSLFGVGFDPELPERFIHIDGNFCVTETCQLVQMEGDKIVWRKNLKRAEETGKASLVEAYHHYHLRRRELGLAK